MHLRSLTLKGFKSFAQATTFAFEPGVTCIVGPNGSGKSNVVDALAWVMGEQGAKTLRGGTMADVIFAGTATRGPLGRAEVVLTIDNADGALPIEYGEVAISRTLFRDGRSDYAINGEGCRLLDVQELLSDSGLGREMHVIVGQGQLDAVLRATPEERRGFVEEAAGILKHRRRKDRTVRKLESMQANLTRLTDLAEELRRQLKPLGAQAEIAREAAGIQAAVREARVRLLAHDAVALAASVSALEQERSGVAGGRQVAEDAERLLEKRVSRLEEGAGGEALDAVRRTALELETVQERLRALAQTAATRVALLAPELSPSAADPGPTGTERAEVADTIAALRGRQQGAEAARVAAGEALTAARAALEAVDARIAVQTKAVADHDRAVAAAANRESAAATRTAAAEADAARRDSAAEAARRRAADAVQEVRDEPAVEPLLGAPDDTAADQRAAAAAATWERLRAALHELEREQSAVEARLAALRAATATPPTVAQVLAAVPGAERLQDRIEVDPLWATAVGAVLGSLVDAAVVPDLPAAVRAGHDVAALGAVDLVAEQAAAHGPGSVTGTIGLPATRVVRAPSGILALLSRVVLVDDVAQAAAAVQGSDVVAVTRSGEVLTAQRVRTAGAAASGLELSAERDRADTEAATLGERIARARTDLADADAERTRTRARAESAAASARDAERAARAADQRRAVLTARAESATAEAERLGAQAAEAGRALAAARAQEQTVLAEVTTVRASERPGVDTPDRPVAAAAVDAAREAELAARLESGTLRERLRSEQARLAALEQRAAQAERAAERAARLAAERAVQRQAAESVLAELPAWQASADASLTEARSRLAAAEQERAERDGVLRAARDRLAVARADLADLDRRSRDLDMRVYEQRVSLGAVQERAFTETGLDAAALAAEAVPGLDRAAEERRLSVAERQLARLGRVNPLALEEFAALEQRHAFLGEQLADLHRTRADLLRIVDDLDVRMREIFTAAYADTEAAFERIFPVLFPGGAGRLTLTEPEEGGEPGIEVAVRPAGKRIERLSLLSGGERSLSAVAFLLAIFTARPSPFYILDEVEAALDDANLGRLLEVVSALRDSSQLILITHQKRTMEIADSLYGVSMRQDGVSSVIGQRMAART